MWLEKKWKIVTKGRKGHLEEKRRRASFVIDRQVRETRIAGKRW